MRYFKRMSVTGGPVQDIPVGFAATGITGNPRRVAPGTQAFPGGRKIAPGNGIVARSRSSRRNPSLDDSFPCPQIVGRYGGGRHIL